MHEGGAAVFTTMFYSLYNRGPKIHPSFPTSRKLEPQKVSKNESFCGHSHPSDEGKGKHTNTWRMISPQGLGILLVSGILVRVPVLEYPPIRATRLSPNLCGPSIRTAFENIVPFPSFRFSCDISLRNKNRNPNHRINFVSHRF